MRSAMILINNILDYIRVNILSLIWSIPFKEVGKGVELNLNGRIKIGKNLRLGRNVSLIVEKNAYLEIGDNVYIGASSYIKCYGGQLIIGDNVSINAHAFINACGGVKIEKDTRIGAKFTCIASNHIFSDRNILMRKQGVSKKGIKVGSNNWLGASVTILDGVVITNNCVIAAGSIVNKPLEMEGIYAGVPAKLKRNL